jgi:tetratricopeptide (TPR) repeat protein
MAITNYDSAIRRRGNFFYYYLQRGRAHEKLAADDSAVLDLEKSLTLLPTAPAHYSLGNIATKRGNKEAAVEHYRKAAGGQGEIAESAKISLVRLDLADNPGTYVLTRCDADTAGKLIVSIKNDTTIIIEGVAIIVAYADQTGTSRTAQRSVRGRIEPEQIISIDTGLVGYGAGSTCSATVVAALIVE